MLGRARLGQPSRGRNNTQTGLLCVLVGGGLTRRVRSRQIGLDETLLSSAVDKRGRGRTRGGQ